MARYNQVDPETLVNPVKKTPEFGRGAWAKAGIDFAGVYALAPEGEKRIGTQAEKSLAHWATAAATLDIQRELKAAGFNPGDLDGVFGPDSDKAVRAFQKSKGLTDDGRFGPMSARALFTPGIDAAEDKYDIPNHYLRGMISAESALDPGAVGYFIYYGASLEYRGVDRGVGQINSKAHPEIEWLDAFKFRYAADYTAKRLRDTFDSLKKSYPKQTNTVLWDAAICSHNNPAAARTWARDGAAPTQAAADYVRRVKVAVY